MKSVFVSILICGHEPRVTTEITLSQEQAEEMGFLRRVQGVTLRDKVYRFKIRNTRNVKPLLRIVDRNFSMEGFYVCCPPVATGLLRIERFQLRWFGHMSRISRERLAKQVLLATTAGKHLRGRRRSSWRDYISALAWSRLGVDRGELSEIAVDLEVFRVHLGLLPPRPFPKEKRARK